MVTGLSPTRMVPSTRTSSTTPSCVSMPVEDALGSLRSRPPCRSGAVTMKIIRRTSTTSTSGTMLISAMGRRPMSPPDMIDGTSTSRFAPRRFHGRARSAGPGRLEEERVGEFGDERSGAAVDGAQPRHQRVVADHGREGGGEAGEGGDERFGNTGSHDHEARRALDADVEKGGHDAPHRPHEADEGRDAAHRGEEGNVALEPLHLVGAGALHG